MNREVARALCSSADVTKVSSFNVDGFNTCQLRCLASTGKDLAGFKAWHKSAREK